MAVEEDFITHLRARSGITAIVRHKIMPLGEVPQSRTKPPYIVYERDSTREHTVDGYAITESMWMFHCYGNGYQATRDLADAVIDAIDGYVGSMTNTDRAAIKIENVVDVFEEPQSDQEQGKHRRSMRVSMWHVESTPSLT